MLRSITTVSTGTLSVDGVRVQAAEAAALALRTAQVERAFWGRTFPAVLLLAAVLVLFTAVRAQRRLSPPDPVVAAPESESRRNLNVP